MSAVLTMSLEVPGLPVYGVDAASLRGVLGILGVDADATLRPLTGGMSNALFLATSAAATPPPSRVVVRLLNPGLDAIIDRGRELRILLRLGAAGVSPRVVGVAHVGTVAVRSEDYLEGRTLVVRDFRSGRVPAAALARAVARMHAELAPATGARGSGGGSGGGGGAVSDWLGQQASTFSAHMAGYLAAIAAEAASGGCCCVAVPEASLLSQPHLTRERLCRLLHALDWPAEVSFVGSLLAERGGPLVLAHNDLQPGNWIEVGSVRAEAAAGAADDDDELCEVAYARRVGRRLDEAELRSGHALSVLSSVDSSSGPPSRRVSPMRPRRSELAAGIAGAGGAGSSVSSGSSMTAAAADAAVGPC